MPQFRPTQILVAITVACLILWITWSTDDDLPLQHPHTHGHIPDGTLIDTLLDHGGSFNITNPIVQASKLRIGVTQSNHAGDTPLLMPLDIQLPTPERINITAHDAYSQFTSLTPQQITIVVPSIPQPPDASAFLFGVATTYTRLRDSLPTLSHWLSGTHARLVAHMETPEDTLLPDKILSEASALSINLGTVDSDMPFLERYFALLRLLWDSRKPTTEWFVFIDDDTFFPDLRALIATFDHKYPSSEHWYIGALTEDFEQMGRFGYMAYGGGGVFISRPLMQSLQPYFEKCNGRDTGDRLLAHCINRHTNTKLTWEHNLHQLDLHGDHAGFYEALRPQPLSVHHWKAGDFGTSIDMYNMTRVASVCGNPCVLQKYQIGDWMLSNGFSLVKYSEGERERDISMERTWDVLGNSDASFEHSLGPLRKRDRGKVSFRMESAVEIADGVRQLYVKRQEWPFYLGKGAVEAIVEIEWYRA